MDKYSKKNIDVAIITGAGRGIGKAIALELGKKGVPVLCISKSEHCKKTSEEIIKLKGTSEHLVCDIANYEEAEKKISDWVSKSSYKKIGVVLAAGVIGPKGLFSNTPLKEWEKCFCVNVFGNLAVLKGLMSRMLKEKFGRIVLFSGGGAAYAFPEFQAYSASKTSNVRIAENLHEELKDKGDFAIVCLAPGAVETDMLKEVKSSGAKVKTTVNISEPVNFVREFLNAKKCNFSGRFIHVRDNWHEYLDSGRLIENENFWKLRRIE